jgi:hypothetical protein
MNTPSIAPTLDDLRSALTGAEADLRNADIGIDNFRRREREMADCRRRVADLKAQIARMEESF